MAAGLACGVRVHPAKALRFQLSTLWFAAERVCIAVTVGFTDGVAAGCQGRCLFVIHRHTGKGDADMLGRARWVRITVHAFWVHIDKTHVHSGEVRIHGFRIVQIGIAIFRWREPFFLFAPIDVHFWRPDVFAAKAKSEGLEACAFIGDITGQQHEVTPR